MYFLYNKNIFLLGKQSSFFHVGKQKQVALNSCFLLLIAFTSGGVINFQIHAILLKPFQATVLRVLHLSLPEPVHFFILGSDPLCSSHSLSSLYLAGSGSSLCKENAATQASCTSDGTYSRERYYFLCFTFESQCCCSTSRGLKTTNKKSEHVQSQFGRFSLAPLLVNSAHVGFILTPFWFSDSFLQFSEPLPKAPLSLPGSWGRAPGCESISHRKQGLCLQGVWC